MRQSDVRDACIVLFCLLFVLLGVSMTIIALRWAFTVPLYGGC